MKLAMIITNGVLTGVSIIALIVNLILGNFGIAWLCIPAIVYFICNLNAIGG